MITANRRTGSLLAAVLAAFVLAVLVVTASPASAANSKMQNREQPWFSGPVCLEIDGGYEFNGGLGQVEWCSYNSVQQHWTAVPLPGTSYYQIKNNNSGRCLEVSGGLFADGTKTIQYDCYTSRTNQQWSFVPVGSGWYEVVARHSGKCLTNSGWNALQYNCDGSTKQHWTRPI